jgi:hypothetical protein
MEQIKILKPFDVIKGVSGRFTFILYWCIVLPLCFVICAGAGIVLLFLGETIFVKIVGLILFIAMGVILLFLFKERNYKPGKTYSLLRGSKKTIMKKQIYIAIVAFIVLCLMMVYDYTHYGSIKHIPQFVIAICATAYSFYYMKKSFKVHEDVDFVTSSEMESIVGVEIGEKIQATYQNFDSSTNEGLQDGANLMIISDKRIYFSFIENGKWSFVKKKINEIVKLGIFDDSNNNQKMHLKLLFSDETSIMLHMETYGKATSNATLFLRKFLEVLDAVVLGTVDEKISSRRRVSVNQETKPVESQQSESKEVRRLDLSEDMMEKLRNATPVESGRVLEL